MPNREAVLTGGKSSIAAHLLRDALDEVRIQNDA